jgi:SAM-dependent methyltransferase
MIQPTSPGLRRHAPPAAPAPPAPPAAPAAHGEAAVLDRYSEGARRPVAELCCPSAGYDPALLAPIPPEVVERDYGCGDPTRHLAPGQTVLDLGSGSGKACFIAAQVVGPEGRVIGADMNDDMLALARGAAPVVAERIGYANVTFLKTRIQDLALDLEALDSRLAAQPVRDAAGLAALQAHVEQQRAGRPLIASDSVDVVISNCVLNLVAPADKPVLFTELHRVLRKGGRAVISDIVCDEDIPDRMAADPELWSGCLSGAYREDLFLAAFERAGFHGIEILERGELPWRTVEGIEFRSLTVSAWKGKQGPCLEQHHAVVYKGPWRRVEDDDGHTLERGQRMAVCGKTHALLTRAPYAGQVLSVEPRVPVPESEAGPFACTGDRLRAPRETKGTDVHATTAADAAACCGPDACC